MTIEVAAPIHQSGRTWTPDALRAVATSAVAAVAGVDKRRCRVAIATSERAVFTAAAAGLIREGIAVVPIAEGRPGPTTEQAELRHRLVDCDPTQVLADESHGAMLDDLGYELGAVLGPAHLNLWRRPAGPRPAPHAEATALIVYTSGSSGRSKGVAISQRALDWIMDIDESLYRWRADDVLLSTLPLTHLAGLTNLLSAMQAGVPVTVSPSFAFPADVAAVLRAHRPTVVGVVPHQLLALSELGEGEVLASIRSVVSSGAPLSAHVLERARSRLTAARVWNAYGMTEAFRSLVAWMDPDADAEGEANVVGRPLPGVEIRLTPVDEQQEDGAPAGEIHVRGPNLLAGYWGQPSPLDDGGWLPTGDLAVLEPDGRYRLVGRRSTFVNIGGEKAPVESVEAVLDAAAPGRIAVTVRDGGDGLEELVVVAGDAPNLAIGDLRRLTARTLPPALRPRHLIHVASLPLTSVGKIDRPALRGLAARPSTAPTQPTETSGR